MRHVCKMISFSSGSATDRSKPTLLSLKISWDTETWLVFGSLLGSLFLLMSHLWVWYCFVLSSSVLQDELSACTCWGKHAATKLHPQPVVEALCLAHSTLCSVELCLSLPPGASASEGVGITWKLGLKVRGSCCNLKASSNRAVNLDEQMIIWILMVELFIWRPEAGRLV